MVLFDAVFVYPLTLLISTWVLGGLFIYTIKMTHFSARTPFERRHIDPLLRHLKQKAIVYSMDVGYTAFRTFRARMGRDTNIRYFSHHCLVDVRDRGRHYTLHLPYRRELKREARFKILAKDTLSGKSEHIHTVPGVPILVSAKELDKSYITCEKPNGDTVWKYNGKERPVCHIVEKDIENSA